MLRKISLVAALAAMLAIPATQSDARGGHGGGGHGGGGHGGFGHVGAMHVGGGHFGHVGFGRRFGVRGFHVAHGPFFGHRRFFYGHRHFVYGHRHFFGRRVFVGGWYGSSCWRWRWWPYPHRAWVCRPYWY